MEISTEVLTDKVIELLVDKKAEDIVTIDVEEGNYADKIVICTAMSELHTKAISQHIFDYCKNNKIIVLSKEGLTANVWILIDLGSIIIHIFKQEIRNKYDLEQLWQDRKAKIVNIEQIYSD